MTGVEGTGGPLGPGIPGAGGAPGAGGDKDLLEGLRSGRIKGDRTRLAAATRLLEASFYQQLFKELRNTVPSDGLTSGGQGEDVFSTLMDQHLAEVSAGRSDRGLGRALYRRFVSAVSAGEESP
jgi:flagellar protein FlgJ